MKVCIHFGKCSKILNIFLFLLSLEMLVLRAEINKMLVLVANKEDPVISLLLQKQSDLGLPCLSRPFWQVTIILKFRTFTLSKELANGLGAI